MVFCMHINYFHSSSVQTLAITQISASPQSGHWPCHHTCAPCCVRIADHVIFGGPAPFCSSSITCPHRFRACNMYFAFNIYISRWSAWYTHSRSMRILSTHTRRVHFGGSKKMMKPRTPKAAAANAQVHTSTRIQYIRSKGRYVSALVSICPHF